MMGRSLPGLTESLQKLRCKQEPNRYVTPELTAGKGCSASDRYTEERLPKGNNVGGTAEVKQCALSSYKDERAYFFIGGHYGRI